MVGEGGCRLAAACARSALRLLLLPGWGGSQADVVQDAVHERTRVLRRELLRDVDRFFDRDQRRDVVPVQELEGRQAQDVAVDRRHALELPVLRDLLDLAVDRRLLLADAEDQLAGEVGHLGGARAGGQRRRHLVQDLVPAQVELVEDLEGQLAGLGALPHSFFMRLAISIAAIAALRPALPILVPARSIACSIVSVVRTPKMQGMPVRRPTSDTPLAVSRQTWS